MTWLHSLRTRFILAYTLLIVLGFGGLAWLAGAQLAGAAREDFARGLVAQAGLIARSLREDVEHMGEHEDDGEESAAAVAMTEQARYLADQVGAQYVIFDRQGRVWLDGSGALPPPTTTCAAIRWADRPSTPPRPSEMKSTFLPWSSSRGR